MKPSEEGEEREVMGKTWRTGEETDYKALKLKREAAKAQRKKSKGKEYFRAEDDEESKARRERQKEQGR